MKIVSFKDRVLTLSEGQSILIGRASSRCDPKASNNNLIFDVPILSRKHAILSLKFGKIFVTDTGSTHGTTYKDANTAEAIQLVPNKPQLVTDSSTLSFGIQIERNSAVFNAVEGRLRITSTPNTPPKERDNRTDPDGKSAAIIPQFNPVRPAEDADFRVIKHSKDPDVTMQLDSERADPIRADLEQIVLSSIRQTPVLVNQQSATTLITIDSDDEDEQHSSQSSKSGSPCATQGYTSENHEDLPAPAELNVDKQEGAKSQPVSFEIQIQEETEVAISKPISDSGVQHPAANPGKDQETTNVAHEDDGDSFARSASKDNNINSNAKQPERAPLLTDINGQMRSSVRSHESQFPTLLERYNELFRSLTVSSEAQAQNLIKAISELKASNSMKPDKDINKIIEKIDRIEQLVKNMNSKDSSSNTAAASKSSSDCGQLGHLLSRDHLTEVIETMHEDLIDRHGEIMELLHSEASSRECAFDELFNKSSADMTEQLQHFATRLATKGFMNRKLAGLVSSAQGDEAERMDVIAQAQQEVEAAQRGSCRKRSADDFDQIDKPLKRVKTSEGIQWRSATIGLLVGAGLTFGALSSLGA